MPELESNQVRAIYSCLAYHGPLEPEAIVERTGWHRYVVDTALRLMEDRELVQKVSEAESGEPIYNTMLNIALQIVRGGEPL